MHESDAKQRITANAAEIRRLHDAIHETVRHRDKGDAERQAWQQACLAFHSRYDELAFLGGYADARKRILSGDRNTIEYALCFLELRPYFFRSGYMFKELVPKLRKASLTRRQQDRFDAFLERWQAWKSSKQSA